MTVACEQVSEDFALGVTAKLIDKSTEPVQWSLPTLAQVTPQLVESYFAPVPVGDVELELPTAYSVHETPTHRTGFLQWNMEKYTPVKDKAPANNASASAAAK